jgi:hypothetical protein
MSKTNNFLCLSFDKIIYPPVPVAKMDSGFLLATICKTFSPLTSIQL